MPAQPPVPRARREQLVLVGGGLEVVVGRSRQHGEQRGVIDYQHKAALVPLLVGDLGVLRGNGVGEPAVCTVADEPGDGGSFLLVKV
jgi:hypothetical protein